MSKVKISADLNGNVVTISENNPDYAHIRVVQDTYMYDDNGWLRARQLSALIHAETETLMKMGYKPDQELPGNIIVKESLTPFSNTDPDRDLKYAGKTGVICRVDDQPIYRRTFYTENPNANHELIQHSNSDEIRAAIATSANVNSSFMSALSKVKTNEFAVAE